MESITLSPLGHTWIIDLDGTVLKHNGYKLDGFDSFLEGAEAFLENIPETDLIIFVTSRTEDMKLPTEKFLREHRIRYDYLICGVPFGERILINDKKPSGLKTSMEINTERDHFPSISLFIDDNL